MDNWEKARENRLRRVAERRGGYKIVRCRRRDPKAVGYGTYYIADDGDRIVAGDIYKFGLSLDQVEDWLDNPFLHQPGPVAAESAG
jgi:hypothetical protein